MFPFYVLELDFHYVDLVCGLLLDWVKLAFIFFFMLCFAVIWILLFIVNWTSWTL